MSEELLVKHCKNIYCKNNNPQSIDCFYKHKKGTIDSVCKDCRKEQQKKYYLEHKEEIKQYQKEYKSKHPDVIKEQNRKWKKQNPERRKVLNKRYLDKNKERLNEKHRLWYSLNPEKKKDYYTKNKDRIRKYSKELYNKNRIIMKCERCGKEILKPKYHVTGGQRFCSYSCSVGSGENNRFWKGGISYEPYCPKFNDDLRFRIREFFDNKCIVCGKSKEENGQNLSCHHVEYNKQACCDNEPVCFAALCKICHNKTSHNRDRWQYMLHYIIYEVYNGKSYYTQEEMLNL